MQTTRQYLHLAGVVFRDDADGLERRLLGASEANTDTLSLGAPSVPLSDRDVDDPR